MSFSMIEELTNRKPVRFLRLPAVKQITGLGKTTLYARINAGEFPAPVKLGGRAVGWIEEEVHQWAKERVAETRLTPQQRSQVVAAA
ncbi:MAG: AlpA family transcriptional regulator [Terracidiphilus sp.]